MVKMFQHPGDCGFHVSGAARITKSSTSCILGLQPFLLSEEQLFLLNKSGHAKCNFILMTSSVLLPAGTKGNDAACKCFLLQFSQRHKRHLVIIFVSPIALLVVHSDRQDEPALAVYAQMKS